MQNSACSFGLATKAPEAVFSSCGITLDVSRQRLYPDEWKMLLAEGEAKAVLEAHRRMLAGEIVNNSEKRAALHTSLRAFSPDAPLFGKVIAERRRMLDFARCVRSGEWKGCTGKKIRNVINIGIGGSAVGPQCVWQALQPAAPEIRVHFLTAADGILLERILAQCDAETTLVIISSKSFETNETRINGDEVYDWLDNSGILGDDKEKHLIVVSAYPDAAFDFALPDANQFHLWNWVGGRFSVWGATGLPVLLGIGEEAFLEFLRGANEMDRHSAEAPLEKNLPAILALIEYRNITSLGVGSLCVLPYDVRLLGIVPWLQQLEMESLGKSRKADGSALPGRSGLPVWGGNGNEAQHSFGQWLREGTGSTAIDMIYPAAAGHSNIYEFACLLANARAQCEALVTRPDAGGRINVLTSIVPDEISPRRLGALMALYEHKTTMLATLLGVNPFDQPAVEYGKAVSEDMRWSIVRSLKISAAEKQPF